MGSGILVVRLGAMGDIIHALPAVASLHRSFPGRPISWLVAPRWMPLLEGNPALHRLIPFERRTLSQLRDTFSRLRAVKPETAFDFQGLFQSAVAGRVAAPHRFWGFTRNLTREPLAALFYTNRANVPGPHRVQQNLQLVELAGASQLTDRAWIPQGHTEGALPPGPFILASPFAGWAGKEWPLENYSGLGARLRSEGLSLVLNVPAAKAHELKSLAHVHVHSSSLAGLIHATRQALAVIGLDSGPLHLAAALEKPGVAIFGPTNPLSHGPYGASLTVIRASGFASTYKRHRQVHDSMLAITLDQVHDLLLRALQKTRTGQQI